MITGFNTDIEHDGVVYHVQTEDKGLETPLILSLVYTGGAILASKRARYDDLIAAGFDEKILVDRLQRQHKLICAAIRAGRIGDLRKMSEREAATRAAAKKEAAPAPTEAPVPPPPVPVAPKASVQPDAPKKEQAKRKTTGQLKRKAAVEPLSQPQMPPASVPTSPAPHTSQALRVTTQLPIADFARAEAAESDALHLVLMDEKSYRGGERVTLRMRVERGAESREPISEADVIVKILGSTFRPLIFQTKTGADGVASISTQLPHFRSGRAAILVRATAQGYEAELRRIIQQG